MDFLCVFKVSANQILLHFFFCWWKGEIPFQTLFLLCVSLSIQCRFSHFTKNKFDTTFIDRRCLLDSVYRWFKIVFNHIMNHINVCNSNNMNLIIDYPNLINRTVIISLMNNCTFIDWGSIVVQSAMNRL